MKNPTYPHHLRCKHSTMQLHFAQETFTNPTCHATSSPSPFSPHLPSSPAIVHFDLSAQIRHPLWPFYLIWPNTVVKRCSIMYLIPSLPQLIQLCSMTTSCVTLSPALLGSLTEWSLGSIIALSEPFDWTTRITWC